MDYGNKINSPACTERNDSNGRLCGRWSLTEEEVGVVYDSWDGSRSAVLLLCLGNGHTLCLGLLSVTESACTLCCRFHITQVYYYPNLSEGADSVGGQLHRDKGCPFSGEFGERCRKAMLGVSLTVPASASLLAARTTPSVLRVKAGVKAGPSYPCYPVPNRSYSLSLWTSSNTERCGTHSCCVKSEVGQGSIPFFSPRP